MKPFIWVNFLGLLLSACMSGTYRISDQNLSLGEVKRIVTSVIGDPRVLSENQRTFYSRYFSRRPDSGFDPEKSRERLYAKVVVLGDRRPYDVEVEVFVEERSGKSYEQVGTDLSEAKKLGQDLRSRLHQGRNERNAIDDFRAF
ncbi:MAG: hypothetical protein ACXWC9_08130 [Pseudobdellovibrionaceae bacterium]